MTEPPTSRTTGRVALVVGAAGHHGRAVTRRLQASRWQVAGLDPRASAADLHHLADATRPDDVDRALRETEASLGEIDLLVLAADRTEPMPFADVSLAAWQGMVDVHLRSAVTACHAVLPGMLARGRGSVIALAPTSALNGDGPAHQAAAATAVVGFIKALAREVGPRGVVVNVVAPGPVDGPTPLGRGVTAEEVAHTVDYLASEPHYFAGQILSPGAGSLL